MGCPLVIKATVHLTEDQQIRLPVIFTKDGILKSYLDYLVYKKAQSQSWIDASSYAICLLVEFVEFNETYYKYPSELFKAFSEKLFTGTVNENGEDLTGLRWSRKSIPTANKIISYITQYSDWLCQNKGLDNEKNLNPWRTATGQEERLNWAAWSHKHKNAFLGHSWSHKSASAKNKLSRSVRYQWDDRGIDVDTAANRFPDEHIDNLIYKGFIKPRCLPTAPLYRQLELRDILITLLLHYGGLRRSETFHLWIDDVFPNPENTQEALVKIFHPERGRAPDIYTNGQQETREETLAKNFGMKPRNKYEKSKKIHAGWKNNKLDPSKDNYMVVHWFEPSAGEIFLFFWRIYLKKQYVVPKKNRKHPFAFTNQNGDPYSIEAYSKKHKRAVERIGLVPDKELGTTEHGHRYAYINRMEKAGVSPLFVANAAHHKSLKSQENYKTKSQKEIREALKYFENKIHLHLTLKNMEEDND